MWVAGTLPVFLNACTFKNNTLAGTQGTGSTIAMVTASSGNHGMLAMNNCTVSGGVYNSTSSKDGAGHLYLRGTSIVSNSTVLGDGLVPAIQYSHDTNWGNVNGSLVINSVICNVSTGTYNPIRLSAWGSYTIKGWYNIYQGLCGLKGSDGVSSTISKFVANNDSVINQPYSAFSFTESNYGTAEDPNYLFDYSIPPGSTVTKVPTVEEVATAIKSQTTARKSGHVFGTMFYNWLTSIDAEDTDARGKVRTTNRQGALVK